jgi:hypothetical protein
MLLNPAQIMVKKNTDASHPSDLSSAGTYTKIDDLISIRHFLGAAEFRRMVYNVVVGHQLVIRCNEKNRIESLINIVKVFCYTRDLGHLIIVSSLIQSCCHLILIRI